MPTFLFLKKKHVHVIHFLMTILFPMEDMISKFGNRKQVVSPRFNLWKVHMWHLVLWLWWFPIMTLFSQWLKIWFNSFSQIIRELREEVDMLKKQLKEAEVRSLVCFLRFSVESLSKILDSLTFSTTTTYVGQVCWHWIDNFVFHLVLFFVIFRSSCLTRQESFSYWSM